VLFRIAIVAGAREQWPEAFDGPIIQPIAGIERHAAGAVKWRAAPDTCQFGQRCRCDRQAVAFLQVYGCRASPKVTHFAASARGDLLLAGGTPGFCLIADPLPFLLTGAVCQLGGRQYGPYVGLMF
jgi:hypothetical protein